MAAQALKNLQEVAKGPNRPVIYTPPEMIPQWQPAFALRLKQAVSAALDEGVAAEKVFKLLDSIATVDLDGIPDDLLVLCIEAGLGADTDMDGESLLHYLLNTDYPIPLGNLNSSSSAAAGSKHQSILQLDEQSETILQKLQALQHTIPAQRHAACGSVTLAELLRRGASPDLPDSSGNTALHMVAACMIRKRHFPDPQVVGQASNQHSHQAGADPSTEAFPGSKGSSAQAAGTAAAGGDQQQQLEDNDAARAAYAAAAFTALVRAGWDPAVRNSNGYTVSDLLLEGLQRYQTELSDLQDPEGVAQTTVALLSQKAPEKNLQQFLDNKIAGIQAVVDALLLLHHVASTVEAPRKRRSVLGLVMMWLLLLLLCVWWIYGRP